MIFGVPMTASVLTLFLCLFTALHAIAQTPSKLKSQEEQIREVMVTMSRQLGVTCTSCHNTDNFKSDKMDNFRLAREHMKLTQVLIDQGMDGKRGPKADCYMCHRGKLKPDFRENLDPLTNK
jgi:cytochrome c-type biogenesis protein CcmH/NrfF